MLVFGHQQRNEHVHIEQRNHRERLFGLIQETVNVLDLEHWGARSSGKHRHATLETHIGVGYTPEQGFCEVVDVLPGLARQFSEPCFGLRIYGDSGRWHNDPSPSTS
jgi:hypothetical protein